MAVRTKKEPKHLDKPKFTELEISNTDKIDKLLEIYAENKYHARVIAKNNPTVYERTRTMFFEWENGDYTIANLTRTFGISKTNIMYHREKANWSIVYTKNKFYYITNHYRQGKKIKLFNYSHLTLMSTNHGLDVKIKTILNDKIPWFEIIRDNPEVHSIPFNTVLAKKLFNRNHMLRHLYKIPLPAINTLLAIKYPNRDNKNDFSSLDISYFVKEWGRMKENVSHVDTCSAELFKNEFFEDSLKMAQILGVKVNLSWSIPKLKLMHDKWSEQISRISLNYEPVIELLVGKPFIDFAELSKLNLLTTNHDLLRDGLNKHHCVGSYISRVDGGDCGIFSVGEYTLELRYGVNHNFNQKSTFVKKMSIGQFKGYYNKDVPTELTNQVNELVNQFNAKYHGTTYEDIISQARIDSVTARRIESKSVKIEEEEVGELLPF